MSDNTWAPIGVTYHRVAVAGLATVCGLSLAGTSSRYYVDRAAGWDAVPVIGEQCAMCRRLTIYGASMEQRS